MSRAAARKHSCGPGRPWQRLEAWIRSHRCGEGPVAPTLPSGFSGRNERAGLGCWPGSGGQDHSEASQLSEGRAGAGASSPGRPFSRCSGHVVCLEEWDQGDTVGRASPLPPLPEAFAQCGPRTRLPMSACAPRGPLWAPPRPAGRKWVFAGCRASQS